MTHIRKVSLVNFQSHRSTELRFSPGVNVIVGQNDSGKTAIWRALRYILLNEPKQNIQSFVQNGSRDFVISVETDKGRVTRTKGASNQFELELNGQEPIRVSRIGTGLTADILQKLHDITGIWSAQIDGSWQLMLNMSDQLDRPFLLFEQGTQAGRIFSRLGSLAKIDQLNQGVLTDRRSDQRKLSELTNQRDRVVQNLEAFNNLDQREYELDQTEAKFIDLQEKSKRLQRLVGYYAEVTRIRTEWSKLSNKLEIAADFSSLYERCHRLVRLQSLKDVYDRHTKELKSTVPNILSVDFSRMTANIQRLAKLNRLKEQYEAANIAIDQRGIEIAVNRSHLATATADLAEAQAEIKICPTCGQTIGTE